MAALDDLLRLQTHDSAVDRLRHRKATLPERPELESKRAAHAELPDLSQSWAWAHGQWSGALGPGLERLEAFDVR